MFSLKPLVTLTAYAVYEFPEETNPVQASSRLIFILFLFLFTRGPSNYEGKIRAKQASLYEERKKKKEEKKDP